jgi:hypothetical protein
MLFYAFVDGILGLIIGSLLSQLAPVYPSCVQLAAAVAGMVYGLAAGLQDRYENQRLICISPDECAIGRIAHHETGPSKGFPAEIDNDFTINLVLTPHELETDQDIVLNDGAQGQRLLRRPFVDLPYEGADPPRAILHCEFEGGRLHSLTEAIKTAAFFIGMAACVCMFVPPWVCALIILAIVAIALLGGWFGGEDGSPADAATDPESGTLEDGDCVVVRGVHIYDAGHCEGWNEIHPVLHVQKLCGKDQTECSECLEGDPTDPKVQQKVNDLVERWCLQLKKPQEAGTILLQKAPENRWVYHPDVDGCAAPAPIP